MLSSRISSAPASTAITASLDRVDLDLDRQVRVRLRGPAGTPRATPPAAITWLSLISAASRQTHPVVDPAAAAHGVLLQGPQQRHGLAGVADDRAGALDRVDPAPGQRGDAGQVAEQVQRGALGGEQLPGLAADAHQHVAACCTGRRRGRRTRSRSRPAPRPAAAPARRSPGPPPRRRRGRPSRRPTPGPRSTVAVVVTSTPPARSSSMRRAARGQRPIAGRAVSSMPVHFSLRIRANKRGHCRHQPVIRVSRPDCPNQCSHRGPGGPRASASRGSLRGRSPRRSARRRP